MFDLGWPELLVVALVLIIVVGPKDLPAMLRTFGKTTRKLRSMAGDFRSQFDDALKEAELGDVSKIISDSQQLNPKNLLKDVIDPLRDAGKSIKSDLDKAMKEPDAKPAETIAKAPETPAPAAQTKPKPVSAAAQKAAGDGAKPKVAKPAAAKQPVAKAKPATPKRATAKTPVAKKPATSAAPAGKAATTAAAARKTATAKKTGTAKKPAVANKTTSARTAKAVSAAKPARSAKTGGDKP
ncbi:MAG: Sec-independent protein translocase protein TatB [Rhizobiaceae bacterium]|nr:Sec-independent protein translocase protein TatB [Rhizobiaceae bacterium]